MRFDYAEREVDPLPWESGLQVIQEPIIPVRFIGPLRTYIIRGLLDTGASMTLLPRSYLTKLGLVPGERVRLRTAAGGHDVWLGALDTRHIAPQRNLPGPADRIRLMPGKPGTNAARRRRRRLRSRLHSPIK